MAAGVLTAAWLLVASGAAIRYEAYGRLETQVRTPFLGELTSSPVVTDVFLIPNGLLRVYDRRAQVVVSYEPALVLRDSLSSPAPELRHSGYLEGTWQADRLLKLILSETATYGQFPFESLGRTGPGAGLVPSSQYLYSGTSLAAESTLGVRRLTVGVEALFFFNAAFGGAADTPPEPGELRLPLSRGLISQAGAYYSFNDRALGTLELRLRHSRFTNGRRASHLTLAPSLDYRLTPLLQLKLELGAALLQNELRRASPIPQQHMLAGSLSLSSPLRLRPHRLSARLRASVVPYIDSLEGTAWPRAEFDFTLDWKYTRQGTLSAGLFAGQSLAEAPRLANQELRLRLGATWAFSRYLAAEASLQLSRTQHLLLFAPNLQWFTSLALVAREERGRL